jgi:hypothetical protein
MIILKHIYLKECKSVDWIQLHHDRSQGRAFVNTTMNLLGITKGKESRVHPRNYHLLAKDLAAWS